MLTSSSLPLWLPSLSRILVVYAEDPDWAGFFGDAVVGHQILPFDDASFLHHLILSKGTIVDFYVQAVDHPIS